jgi:predicted CopG family antitoxin
MNDDLTKGKKAIADVLPQLADLDKQKQSSMLNQVFFSAKANEIIDIFSKGNPMERIKIYNVMVEADPANSSKYEELKKIFALSSLSQN